MSADYDASSSGREESESGHHTVVGSVLGRFGVHSSDSDRPADETPADSPDTADPADMSRPAESAEPAADDTGQPLTGTLTGPARTGETSPAVTGTLAGPDETGPTLTGTTAEPAAADEPFSPGAAPSPPGMAVGVSEPSMSGLNGPLIDDAAGLRGNWQRLQAGFVDDPRAAVGDAADLVEHAAQVLVGALQQRQRSLRDMWDSGRSTGGNETADTERLRLVMQRYRTLFNEICPP